MTADDTARAILESDKPAFIPSGISPTVDAAMEKYFANYHADLQAMAKLWLMRDEIIAFMDWAFIADYRQQDYLLREKLKALEGE